MTRLSDALAAMDKATPGPWSCGIDVCCTENEKFMATHESNDCWVFGADIFATEENAAVIAAAPDALAWIKKALPWLVEMRLHVSLDPQHFESELADLDAMIAQATGEKTGVGRC